ncbi:DUF4089 domain-containing protein [Muricoccus nepalensis]|uniref:DUF4089 domain-containing protein n=1 Tax=Muricoccus nepalensis TaxID=1854500 RepID=UPI0019D6464C|nr:DUF4089 domain-containing protein [Roseomonas nepalensis]
MPADLPPLPDDATLLALLDAAALANGIPVDPAWRPEVLANFRAVANAARAFLPFPLEDESEPAPVFRA